MTPSVKKSLNRLIIGEVMGKSLMSCFLTHSVVSFELMYSLVIMYTVKENYFASLGDAVSRCF